MMNASSLVMNIQIYIRYHTWEQTVYLLNITTYHSQVEDASNGSILGSLLDQSFCSSQGGGILRHHPHTHPGLAPAPHTQPLPHKEYIKCRNVGYFSIAMYHLIASQSYNYNEKK